MSTIIVAAIFIAAIILISIAFLVIHKNAEQKRKAMQLSQFDEELSKRGLSFSERLVLKKRILAFDPISRLLLILETSSFKKFSAIPLSDINHCLTTRRYENINMGSDKKEVIEKHLRAVSLELHLKTSAEPLFIPFYENNVDGMFEIVELENHAKSWEKFLLKTVLEHSLRA